MSVFRNMRFRYTGLRQILPFNGGRMSRPAAKFRSLFICVALMITGAAFAQDDQAPKVDVFVGYQWLNPGATVATSPSNVRTGTPLPSSDTGVGATATYNFSKIFGLSVDAGGNWRDNGHEITLSVGPRVMWR